jgi:hypothetical protein
MRGSRVDSSDFRLNLGAGPGSESVPPTAGRIVPRHWRMRIRTRNSRNSRNSRNFRTFTGFMAAHRAPQGHAARGETTP